MNSRSTNRTRVKAVFALLDQHKLMVHLSDFDWDFKKFGSVILVIGNECFRFNYTASGNQQGVPFVVLQPEQGAPPSIMENAHALFSLARDDCWIVRPDISEG